MKFKLDENVPLALREQLADAGFGDTTTVQSERIPGVSDRDLAAVCRAESRVLITLDHDFTDPMLFPPSEGAGFIVLESLSQGNYAIQNLFQDFMQRFPLQRALGKTLIVSSLRVVVLVDEELQEGNKT